MAIVDGEWYTGGSANLVDLSLEKDHTELNISVWDKPGALRFLADLCKEHTGGIPKGFLCSTLLPLDSSFFSRIAGDVEGASDVEMVKLVQQTAKFNTQALQHGKARTTRAQRSWTYVLLPQGKLSGAMCLPWTHSPTLDKTCDVNAVPLH